MSVEPAAHPSNPTIPTPAPGNSFGIHSITGEYIQKKLYHIGGRILTLLFICGIFASFSAYSGAFFRMSIVWANDVRHGVPELLYLLPLGGILIALLYKKYKTDTRNAFTIMSEAVQTNKTIPTCAAPLIWVSSVITHLFGGSSGCEAASLLIGGGMASTAGRWFHLNREDTHALILCSMAAAFTPLLGTPVAAALFVVELTRSFNFNRLCLTTISAIIAYAAVAPLNLHPVQFDLPKLEYSAILVAQVLIVTAASGLSAGLFTQSIDGIARLVNYSRRPVFAIVLGAIAVVGLSLILGTSNYNGLGLDVIAQALHGISRPDAFIWKLVLTAITLGVGFKGGQIVPAFFIGATLGSTISGVIGLNVSLGAAIGLIAVFAAVVKCPLTALVLSVEIFGFSALPLFALSCGALRIISRK